MARTKMGEDGVCIRKATKTDPIGEVTYCGGCGRQINWASDVLFGRDLYQSDEEWETARGDTHCPFCSSRATDWIPA